MGCERYKRGWDQSTGALKVGVHSWKPPLLATGALSGPGVTPSLFISLEGGIFAKWEGGGTAEKSMFASGVY